MRQFVSFILSGIFILGLLSCEGINFTENPNTEIRLLEAKVINSCTGNPVPNVHLRVHVEYDTDIEQIGSFWVSHEVISDENGNAIFDTDHNNKSRIKEIMITSAPEDYLSFYKYDISVNSPESFWINIQFVRSPLINAIIPLKEFCMLKIDYLQSSEEGNSKLLSISIYYESNDLEDGVWRSASVFQENINSQDYKHTFRTVKCTDHFIEINYLKDGVEMTKKYVIYTSDLDTTKSIIQY